MLHIVLAALFVAMVMGEGCCPPDAWEGVVGLMIGSVHSKNLHLTKKTEYFIMAGRKQNNSLRMASVPK
ncbi:hypothetical protein CHS0354_025962 [Potamilus streckersoni]|uniref:Uncharacterized protein n=1 Tax=Potamilus streckersoni TaxID=2493646 RepID=A0AAE0T4D1_9BIVA|nr:hypothetical protein CHS0354_025962 [Potamilus streckersoni]